MGEFALRYHIGNKHKLVQSFRYWLSQTIEYGFAYQMFVALYDTRIFDSPVVITKVATGLPFISGKFVWPRQSFDMETLSGLVVAHDGKSIEHPNKYDSFFTVKDGKSFIVNKDEIFISRKRHPWPTLVNGVLLSRMDLNLGVYEMIYDGHNDLALNNSPTILANPGHSTLNIYQNQTGKPHTNGLNHNQEYFLRNWNNGVNDPYSNILGREPTYIVTPIENILAKPYKNDLGAIYTHYLARGMRNSTNILPVFMAIPDRNSLVIDNLFFARSSHDDIIVNDLHNRIGFTTDRNSLVELKTLIGRTHDKVVNHYGTPIIRRINHDRLVINDDKYVSNENKYIALNSKYWISKQQYEMSPVHDFIDMTITWPQVQYMGDDYFLNRENYQPEINGFIGLYKTITDITPNQSVLTARQDPRVNYDYYMLKAQVTPRVVNYDYYMRLGRLPLRHIYMHKDETGYAQALFGIVNLDAYAKKDNPIADVQNIFYSLQNQQKRGDAFSSLSSSKRTGQAVYLGEAYMTRDPFYGDDSSKNTLFGSQSMKDGDISAAVFAKKDNATADKTASSLFVQNPNKIAFGYKNTSYAFKDKNDFNITHNDWVARSGGDISVYDSDDTNQVYRDRTSVTSYQYTSVYRGKHSSSLYGHTDVYRDKSPMALNNARFINKDNGEMYVVPKLFVSKDREGILNNDSFSAYKAPESILRQSGPMFTFQDNRGIDVNIGLYGEVAAKGIFVDQYGTFGCKLPDSMNLEYSMLSGIKQNEKGFLATSVPSHLDKKDARYYGDAMSLLKESLSARNVGAIESAIKAMWHVRLNNFGSSHNGIIIPVTKSYTDVSAFNNDIGKMARKIGKESFVTENAMASILQKPAFLDGLNYVTSEKMYQDVMMDVYNYFAEKQVIKAAVQSGVHTYHAPYNAYVDQSMQQLFKENAEANYGDYCPWELKQAYDTIVYDQIMTDIHKKAFDTTIYKAEFADEGKYGLYYFYETFAKETQEAMKIFGQLQATEKVANMSLYNAVPASWVSRDIALYEPVVYGLVPQKDLNVAQQLKTFEKSRKEVEEFLSDFGNWAWVYETPSPFDSKVYGIDELLLPEEDPRYEQFEDIIFDKESMIPRDPVKMLSPTSFIARYPIDMPIEEFADIGAIYDDSAEKWEQYFGIETDVMKDIYLKYYQIWQTKIFEFSTMTMVQSTKKMLEYLYTWIDMYYPVEKIPQALRVFRQIRWYSESAVIRNSQYIISYEYDTLKSDLHTGVCHIPNDLDAVTNPTMYVDKQNAVIRNNKAFLQQDAHVTFEIDNQKNTHLKLDLYTEYGKGTALIYLNDKVERVLTSWVRGIIIQIPYTGTTNRVTIIKKGTNNVGEFYIGNLSIPNATFKDLTIEFDPVLRAGNKPLEEVAKKMIACANLYADKNEMYAVIKKSSLGFSETYRQMNDYWKLHHQDKVKGKRLTIKQV